MSENGSLMLRVRVLGAHSAHAIADDRMFEEYRARLDFPDQPRRDIKPGDERALPRLQCPGQHWRAHACAQVNERNDVQHVMAEIRLVRIGDQQMLPGQCWNAAEPLPVEPVLSRSIGRGAVDDRLDRRQEAILKGPQERMAPNQPFRRNEEAESRKPVLIDEMLERHRRRVDGMIEIVDALGRRRIHALRMQSRPVLARLDDHALGEGWGKRPA